MNTRFFEGKTVLYLSFLLMLITFFAARFPFYYSFFIPEFHHDTFDYYYTAFLIKNNLSSELHNLPIDIPLGYPFLLVLFYNSPNIIILIFQSLVFFTASICLFSVAFKHFGKYSFFLLFLIVIYYFDHSQIRFETSLFTESIFISLIFFFMAIFIKAVLVKSKISIALLFIVTTLLIMFRPNGIIFIVAPASLLLISAFRNKKLVRLILFGYFLQIIMLSSLNLIYKGYFFPVEYKRYIEVFKENPSSKISVSDNSDAGNSVPFIHSSKSPVLLRGFFAYTDEYPSFYYSTLPVRINQFEERKNYAAFNGSLEINPQLKSAFLKDFELINASEIKEPVQGERNFTFFINIIAQLQHVLVQNIIFLFAFVLSFFLILYLWIIKKKRNDMFLIIIMMFVIYCCNVIFSAFGNSFEYRYFIVFDSLVWCGVFVAIYLIPLGFIQKLVKKTEK